MYRGDAYFSSGELAQVLGHYDIGVVLQVKPLSAGGGRVPKMVIVSEQGKFLLKRRPKNEDNLCRIAFAHAVQTHLAERAFPVTSLVATRDANNTILQLNNHIYEFFKFVTGVRYDRSAEATVEAGRQLAQLHRHLADFSLRQGGVGLRRFGGGSFHDSSTVRRHLKAAGSEKAALPDKRLRKTAERLMALYNASSVRVDELGFDSWPQQVVHGDWHPGNMLFSEHKLVAVLDFDSARVAPTVTDLANGMLQFSIVAGRPNPADWPEYLDQAKVTQFLAGYRVVTELKRNELVSLLDLMIETMIAEAILPVAATGFFGSLGGADFLEMIRRKAEWIEKNRRSLAEAIGAGVRGGGEGRGVRGER